MERTIGFLESCIVAALTALAAACGTPAADAPPDLGACTAAAEPIDGTGDRIEAGLWLHARPPTILGRWSGHVLWIEEEEDGWVLTHYGIHDPGIRPREGRGARTAVRGETMRLRADRHRLTLEGPDGELRPTYRFDGERLVVPALVEEAPHAWAFTGVSTWRSSGRVEPTVRVACLTDPAVDRTGPARWSVGVTTTPAPPSERTYEVLEEPGSGPLGVLRFLESTEHGDPRERLRLTWYDGHGISCSGPDSRGITETVHRRIEPGDTRYQETIELLRNAPPAGKGPAPHLGR
ncbi:MAG: hypothetical protein AAF726_05205 [Planctomycetota bacterium]